jgi:hypothetical protein
MLPPVVRYTSEPCFQHNAQWWHLVVSLVSHDSSVGGTGPGSQCRPWEMTACGSFQWQCSEDETYHGSNSWTYYHHAIMATLFFIVPYKLHIWGHIYSIIEATISAYRPANCWVSLNFSLADQSCVYFYFTLGNYCAHCIRWLLQDSALMSEKKSVII